MNVDIVVVGSARTPLGAMQGTLSSLSASQLGGFAIAKAIECSGISVEQVDEVYMGCVLSAGVGQAPARQAAIYANIPSHCPATTINKVCGSGMKSVQLAMQSLRLGEASLVVAGGMECMSQSPYMLSKARDGYRLGHGELLDSMFIDGLQDSYSGNLMGVFAENTADKYGFTREAQDAFALESIKRSRSAIEKGVFEKEIASVEVTSRQGVTIVGEDELPGRAKPDKVQQLKPAFRNNGTVTAANASSIADGAAALVLATKAYAHKNGLPIIAEIKAVAEYAHEPEWFTTAPVTAIKRVLEKMKWHPESVDLYEINEAFAVVTMAAMHDLSLPQDKVNIYGGACSLGHPLGASGARILVTLVNALRQEGKQKGVASLCIGGGEAIAMAIECGP